MAKHAAAPGSTQAAHPWRATFRTAVAVGVPLFLALPEAIQIILETFGTTLPEGARAWLLGLAGMLTLTAAAVTRIMALRSVIAVTSKIPGLSPAPAAATPKETA